jgi:phosphoribosyl-AMP cyclohydrolase
MTPIDKDVLSMVNFDANGLVAAIVQSASGRVLMLAWMNAESLEQTLNIGETVFFSRSRQELWHKGATSGNTQRVLKIELDCDSDALLIQVEEAGPACHTGEESCFDVETLFISGDQ